MNLVQVKVEKDVKIAKYISLIRKFDPTLSVGQIKSSIENNLYVVGFDLHYFDVLEDIQGMDRKSVFRGLIADLMAEGAQLSIYSNDELWTLEHLDNRLHTLREISDQTERDMDLESDDE
ncbi:hypothetical protein [Gorillibacterium sp. CAU 1737]|uniref:hypothetical protein n=1 Tax=Gorillibacterium sp. CAU 1737 TaxID=3140362 RepID=UPI003261056D